MKKSERLNQELIFLRDKKSFNIKDLTDEFSISKRTALRDIADLESMGLPLYSKSGRGGRYIILDNELPLPIYFSEDEISSILFAISALENLITTPFDKSYRQIYQKLTSTLSDTKAKNISEYMENIRFKGITSVSEPQHLKILLSSAKSGIPIYMEYDQYGYEKTMVYIYDLFFQDGVWFFNGYDLTSKSWKIYRCDFIISCNQEDEDNKTNTPIPFKNKEDARLSLDDFRKLHETLEFKCQLTDFGKELFLKTDYFDMKLVEDEDIYLTGRIEEKNLGYLVDYLITFGDNLRIIYPRKVVNLYKDKLKNILKSYNT